MLPLSADAVADPVPKRAPAVKVLRAFTLVIIVAFCVLAFAFTSLGVLHSLLQKDAAGKRDFIEYWAAGQQLAHHANPYDSQALLAIERSAGFPADAPVMVVRNPPIVLPLLAPLGHLPPRAAELIWCSLLLALLLASVWMVSKLHHRHITALDMLAVFFGPALCCLLTGQMSMLMLLGVALFLFFHRTRPVLAGAGLALCLVKPHLLLPFAVVLMFWTIEQRRYRLLIGATSALAIAAAVAYRLDPNAWSQCAALMRESRADIIPLPSFSSVFRRSMAPTAMWLQYLPATLGSLWALVYYRRHRREWDWTTHGSLVTLVSVAVAPYSWFTDQVVLIPALLHALYVTGSRPLIAALALASALTGLTIFGGGTWMLHSPWLLWTAPFWLGWYLLATRARSKDPSSLAALTTPVH